MNIERELQDQDGSALKGVAFGCLITIICIGGVVLVMALVKYLQSVNHPINM